MKLLISGSRSITDLDLAPYIPDDVDVIICGGAKGVDTLAEEYADKHRLSKIILRPKYNLYHKCAPLKRNDEMIKIADSILVFWDGKSKGTKYTIDVATKQKKNIKVILI